MLTVIVLVVGWRRSRKTATYSLAVALVSVLCVSSLVFVVVGIGLQKAFWARHFAPIFPFYVCLAGLAMSRVAEAGDWRFKSLPWLLVGFLMVSALMLRFAPLHRKDDYRSAAEIARKALSQKKTVWWVGPWRQIPYYRLPFTQYQPEAGKVFYVWGANFDDLARPDMIIYSKPDSFDSLGLVQRIIKENGYRVEQRLQSVDIWVR
jgi:hypothetical protein